MRDARFAKSVVFVNSLVPLALMAWDWAQGKLGANPVEFLTRTTGMLTLVFLLISLAVTPLRKLTGVQWLIQFRRMLGLYAFFYGFLHLMTYIWFDRGSWNRAKRTGYKVIRVPQREGVPTGEYVDFLTGFVTPEGDVWGRPVGVAVAKDGALFVSDDGSNTVWRVSYAGK